MRSSPLEARAGAGSVRSGTNGRQNGAEPRRTRSAALGIASKPRCGVSWECLALAVVLWVSRLGLRAVPKAVLRSRDQCPYYPQASNKDQSQ